MKSVVDVFKRFQTVTEVETQLVLACAKRFRILGAQKKKNSPPRDQIVSKLACLIKHFFPPNLCLIQ